MNIDTTDYVNLKMSSVQVLFLKIKTSSVAYGLNIPINIPKSNYFVASTGT
jgi:hypothetical protein